MRGKIIALTLIISFGYSAPASSFVPADAAGFIEGLGTRAMAVLREPGAGDKAKEEQVRSLLAQNLDLDKIGQFVVGHYWRTMSSEQQNTYLTLFREFVPKTYADRLGGYSGDKFVIVGTRPVGQNDVLVATQIERSDGPSLDAGWRVATENGEPKIVDVVISGVSMIMTQRSEFTSVIGREGINGLVSRLRSQLSSRAQPAR